MARAAPSRSSSAAWFPDGSPAGDFVEGATLRFGPDFTGQVITADPPRVLEFMWGDDTLRFELRPDGTGTVLTFTDTFDDYGKSARDGAGWHACVENLVHVLDGTEPPADAAAHWREIYADYQRALRTRGIDDRRTRRPRRQRMRIYPRFLTIRS